MASPLPALAAALRSLRVMPAIMCGAAARTVGWTHTDAGAEKAVVPAPRRASDMMLESGVRGPMCKRLCDAMRAQCQLRRLPGSAGRKSLMQKWPNMAKSRCNGHVHTKPAYAACGSSALCHDGLFAASDVRLPLSALGSPRCLWLQPAESEDAARSGGAQHQGTPPAMACRAGARLREPHTRTVGLSSRRRVFSRRPRRTDRRCFGHGIDPNLSASSVDE